MRRHYTPDARAKQRLFAASRDGRSCKGTRGQDSDLWTFFLLQPLPTQLLDDERALARGEQFEGLDEFGGAAFVNVILIRRRGREEEEAADVEREREEGDVA